MLTKKSQDLLQQQLSQIGLSESEAAFYLAAAQLGKSPVRKIANKANLNRSSSYAIVSSLKAKGIVSAVKKAGGVLIEPISPKKLIEKQRQNLQSVEQSIEMLNTLFRVVQQEPGVTYYEGKEGLKNVLQDTLQEAKDICIFGDGDAFKQSIPGWTETYSARRTEQGIRARIILRGTKETIASIKNARIQKGKKMSFNHIRVLPEAMNIVGGFDVYGYKTILYTFDEKNMAIVIESSLISKMMQSLFEILWSLAETYERSLLR